MDEHFYNNDFEKFLQQQVKHHRMYPSDAVWKGIYKQVHGHKKWPGLYFFAILIVASLTVCTLFIESQPVIHPQQTVAKATTLKYDQLIPGEITEHTINDIIGNEPAVPADMHTFQVTDNPAFAITDTETVNPEAGKTTTYQPVDITITYNDLNTDPPVNTGLVQDTDAKTPSQGSQLNNITANNSATAPKKVITVDPYDEDEAIVKTKNPTDTYLDQHPEEVDRIVQQKIRTKPSRWQLQFYIAPSMNYRVIVDEKPGEPSAGPVATNYGVNASKVIRYNPGMGIEFGVGAMYSLNNKLKVKAAFQYNVRQYNIEAYAGSTELAKIALIRGDNVDTMLAISRFRSSGLYGEAQLTNKYHQVSLPVGLEYSLFNSKRFGLNLGGTLQPTYTFSQSSYLLSSDYKSYANGKSILRRWNLNSSLEAMFTYNARNVQWRFGPQLRYQHLPNYTDAYPIKEYLIDYGFKIGFTKAIK